MPKEFVKILNGNIFCNFYNLRKLKEQLKRLYDIDCLINKSINGIGTIYYELSINRRKEVEKLINLKLIPNLFKDKQII